MVSWIPADSIPRKDGWKRASGQRKRVWTPRTLILDRDGALGPMSKQGLFQLSSTENNENLESFARSSWGGKLSVHRFEEVDKGPMQRAIQDAMFSWDQDALSDTSKEEIYTKLLTLKKELLKSKHEQMDAKKKVAEEMAQEEKESGSRIFEILREVDILNEEIANLSFDIDRLTHLIQVNRGIEEKDPKYFNFENMDIRFWTDFNKNFLHANNMLYLEDVYHDAPFETYSAQCMGRDQLESYEEKLRTLAESCNLLDGFQLIIDADTTWVDWDNQIRHLMEP